MQNRYDWNDIEQKTNGKAQYAATDCGIVFASDKKPYYDSIMGWCVDKPAEIWEICKTEDKTKCRLTLEEKPKQNQ